MKKILSFLCMLLTITACTSPDANLNNTAANSSLNMPAVKQSIESTNKQFADAVLRGDSTAVVNLYHSNAMVYAPNMPAGDRTTMGAMAATMPKMGVKTFSLSTTDVSGDADMVLETGTYEMGDGAKTIDKGKYIVAWKPENGNWKLWRDIWNSDNAPTAAAQ